jgi:hypothetical protein
MKKPGRAATAKITPTHATTNPNGVRSSASHTPQIAIKTISPPIVN